MAYDVIGPYGGIITISSTAYTIQAGDNKLTLCFLANTPITVTVPTGLPVGFYTTVVSRGTGIVTLVPAIGITLHNEFGGFTTLGQWGLLDLTAYVQDAFIVGGGRALAPVYVGDTPPLPGLDGQLWFDSNSVTLFVRYNDGNSSQWVPAVNTPGPIGPSGPPGNTVEPSIQVSTSYALASTEAGNVFVTGQTAPVTITLPIPLAIGHRIMVKDADGGAATNPITVVGNGGAQIDDMSAFAISYGFGAGRFTWSGSRWSLG